MASSCVSLEREHRPTAVNLLHCMPPNLPEEIFRQLSPSRSEGPLLTPETGFVATYGPFLADDGTYRSEGDRQVGQVDEDRPPLSSSLTLPISKLRAGRLDFGRSLLLP